MEQLVRHQRAHGQLRPSVYRMTTAHAYPSSSLTPVSSCHVRDFRRFRCSNRRSDHLGVVPVRLHQHINRLPGLSGPCLPPHSRQPRDTRSQSRIWTRMKSTASTLLPFFLLYLFLHVAFASRCVRMIRKGRTGEWPLCHPTLCVSFISWLMHKYAQHRNLHECSVCSVQGVSATSIQTL